MADIKSVVLAATEATHAGVARAFAQVSDGMVRWPEGGEPLLYNEGRWQESSVLLDRKVADFCEEVSEARRDMSDDPPTFLRSSGGIASVTARLPSEPGIYCAADAFNQNPNVLGVGNGVVDLRTGAVVKSTPDLLISQFARGRYLPDCKPEGLAVKWLEGLQWSLPTDVVDYLQLLVGASLFGTNQIKAFIYLWGVTDAGKSSFTDPLLRALGDYSASGSVALVAGNQAKGSEHTDHLLPMAERRVVVVPEVGSSLSLNAGQIKALTGDDTITMRGLYSKGADRRITATLWMMGNPQSPRFDASDQALVNRLRVIPFNRKREGKDLDPALLDRMRNDPMVHDAALTWAIKGAIRFYQGDASAVLREPAAVSEAKEQYVDQHDELGVWLETNTREMAGKESGTRRSELLGNLNDWEREQHVAERHLTTARGFAGAMRARGFIEKKVKGYPTIERMLREEATSWPPV